MILAPVESIKQNLGGVVILEPSSGMILKEYVHTKKWVRSGWRGGVIYNGVLIATDWTHLHYFDIKKWKYIKSFTKNTFNDLHYLEIHNDLLYVVNTGIDAIEIFSDPMNPKFEDIFFIFDICNYYPKRNIDLKKEYNKIFKNKPHSAHPNYITFKDNVGFITCFGKQDIKKTGRIITFNGKSVIRDLDLHDGFFINGSLVASETRANNVLFVDSVMEKRWPLVTERLEIGRNGWWRGSINLNQKLFIFASDGYRQKGGPLIYATINLKKRIKEKIQPVICKNVIWDTIYSPRRFYEDSF